jgi:hypothetical protein
MICYLLIVYPPEEALLLSALLGGAISLSFYLFKDYDTS